MSQNLLEQLKQQKEVYNTEISNIKFIKNKKAKELKEQADKLKYVKKNSVLMYQNLPSKQEIYEESNNKFKKAWKDPGYCNQEFSEVPILKPKLLDCWTMQKCIEPDRNNIIPKKSKGFRIRHQSELFEEGDRNKLYPERFQIFLKKKEEDFIEFKMRASKFQKLEQDLRLEKLIRDNKEVFRMVNTVQNREFGHNKHSTWEKEVHERNWI